MRLMLYMSIARILCIRLDKSSEEMFEKVRPLQKNQSETSYFFKTKQLSNHTPPLIGCPQPLPTPHDRLPFGTILLSSTPKELRWQDFPLLLH